jgi:3'(2'), 5'-bisphosphate nucleotidase
VTSLLSAVRAIATDAGRLILEHYGRPFDVEYKADDSPLTIADRASHALIAGRLAELTPDIPVLSEEGEPEAADRAGWTRFWCVDPLDGTKEFVKRTGEFTVNIALVEAGRPVLGVVHVPALGRTYFAQVAGGQGARESGGQGGGASPGGDGDLPSTVDRPPTPGAWRADAGGPPVPIRARQADPRRLTVVASRDHAGPEVAAVVDAMRAAGVEVELASMGSALKFCLVAEGAADFYPRTGPTMEWDTGAAQAVVEAAGGRVTDLAGRPLAYNKGSLVNPPIVAFGDPALRWRAFL